MSSKLVLLVSLALFLGAFASPFGKGEEEEEQEQPGYEINPHFGFRKYFEIRYEPLNVPFPGPLPQGGPAYGAPTLISESAPSTYY